MHPLTRRAFLAAIAGTAVAPHVSVDREPLVYATEEWLDTVYPHWPIRLDQLIARGWILETATHGVWMPRCDVLRLAEAYADRCTRDLVAAGHFRV